VIDEHVERLSHEGVVLVCVLVACAVVMFLRALYDGLRK
jgi:hypothetical protein